MRSLVSLAFVLALAGLLAFPAASTQAQGCAAPFRAFTVNEGRFGFDYHVQFRIPRNSAWCVYATNIRAGLTLTVSRATGGVKEWDEGGAHIVEFTAGLRARTAGGYFTRDAWTWARGLGMVFQ